MPEPLPPQADSYFRGYGDSHAKDQRKDKFYASHAPEVQCIRNMRVRNPYEFGVHVSVATKLKEGIVLGCAPYQASQSIDTSLGRLSSRGCLTDLQQKVLIVEKVFQSLVVPNHRSCTLADAGVTRIVRKMIKRRSSIEHMNMNSRLERNELKAHREMC